MHGGSSNNAEELKLIKKRFTSLGHEDAITG